MKAVAYDLCGSDAKRNWDKMSDENQKQILNRYNKVKTECPELAEYIEDLKYVCHPTVRFESYDLVVKYYQERDEEDIVEALLTCRKFYDFDGNQ